MSDWTQQQIDAAWEKGFTINGKDANTYRTDACGALMKKSEHGEKTKLGWQIDHIFPKSKAEERGYSEDEYNHIENLRPMHWENNNSKNDDYPKYQSAVTRSGETNIDSVTNKTVTQDVQDKLAKRFPVKSKTNTKKP